MAAEVATVTTTARTRRPRSNTVLPGTGRPGGGAEIQYKAALRRWRRHVGWRRWWVAVAAGLLLVGSTAVDGGWARILAAVGGCFAGLFLTVDELAPQAVRRLHQGAEGERDTARVLGRLGNEWSVRHDLNGPSGNIDHLVVGPAGVFVLDTKAWWGHTLTINNGVPIAASRFSDWDRGNDWKTLPRHLKAVAAATSDSIRALTGRSAWVTAVAVVWCDFPERVVTADNVTYVHGAALADWMASRPHVLGQERIRQIREALGA